MICINKKKKRKENSGGIGVEGHVKAAELWIFFAVGILLLFSMAHKER